MTQSYHYDIIVVGAGPAGSMAARASAEAGRSVCLVERQSKPGAVVRCGEGIGLKGAALSLDIPSHWRRCRIERIQMVSPDTTRVTIGRFDSSWIIDRSVMDRDLANDAVSAGARLICGTTVTAIQENRPGDYLCRTTQGEFRSKCVIIADGVESQCARSLGWETHLRPKDIETCAFTRIHHPRIETGTCRFFVGKTITPGGYAWVFPRGESSANVGLGVLGQFHSPGMAEELLEEFLSREFPGAEREKTHCGGVPVGPCLKSLVSGGVMIAGDAARQVNALTGAGIAYSLFAGKTAGTVAARSFCGKECNHRTLKDYEKIWKARCGKQQHRSYLLKEALLTMDDAFFNEVAHRLSREDPRNISYRRVFLKTFFGRPMLLLKVFQLFR